MASIAGARRTESSFHQFLESTDPSDLALITGLYHPDPTGYDPGLVKEIAQLPHVARIESEVGYEAEEVGPTGLPVQSAITSGLKQVGLDSSVDGVFFNMDRLVVLSGRMPNPARANEVAVTADAARLLGVHLGSQLHIGVVSNVQSTSNCSRCRPPVQESFTVVGIVTSSGGIVIDDTDESPTIIATPAFTKLTLRCCAEPTISELQITGGTRNLAAVESEIARMLPHGLPQLFTPTASVSEATAQRIIRPDAIALGVFGLIVSLVALIISVQLIGRQLRLDSDELDVLRALGAKPTVMLLEGLIGVVGAVVAGSLLAGLVAFLLSPLAPIGPVRPVYPTRGLSLDGVVLALGVLTFVVVLSGVAIVISYRRAPHRIVRRRDLFASRSSVTVRGAMTLGLSAPAVCGIRFALDPGKGRLASPVRSAVVGTVVAISVVVATLTFGSSLNTLVSRPALYGWNWTVAMAAAGGVGAMPLAQTKKELNNDPDVAAWSGFDFAQLQIDGKTESVLGVRPGAAVEPPVLSGHGLRAPSEIVLGTQTLAQLHKRVGGTVMVSSGAGESTRLDIVGTATLPAFGGQQHTELGTGALVDYKLIPASARNLFDLPGGGPNAVFIRMKTPTETAALNRLNKIALVLQRAAQDEVVVVPVQRPAEVADAGTLRAIPTFLAFALFAGALVALGLTLVASVNRRRRDLALLKALGFTQRQLAAAVAWQATVAAIVGLVVGVPAGAVIGRELWSLLARSISVVAEPTVPVVPLLLVAVGALVFANVVALLPGRRAARTRAAIILGSE
jgi:ABC-type lipoprotein release transport system permease subunit